jgi:hypothetical protein
MDSLSTAFTLWWATVFIVRSEFFVPIHNAGDRLGLCLSGLMIGLAGCAPRLNVTEIEAEIKTGTSGSPHYPGRGALPYTRGAPGRSLLSLCSDDSSPVSLTNRV